MKLCSRCRIEKDDGAFHRKGDGLQPNCKVCLKEYHKAYYAKNIAAYKAKSKKNKQRQRAKIKAIVDVAKKAPCADCGKNPHPWAMEFDHIRGEKITEIATLYSRGCPVSVLEAELAKTELVCANCHRIRTYNRFQAVAQR